MRTSIFVGHVCSFGHKSSLSDMEDVFLSVLMPHSPERTDHVLFIQCCLQVSDQTGCCNSFQISAPVLHAISLSFHGRGPNISSGFFQSRRPQPSRRSQPSRQQDFRVTHLFLFLCVNRGSEFHIPMFLHQLAR